MAGDQVFMLVAVVIHFFLISIDYSIHSDYSPIDPTGYGYHNMIFRVVFLDWWCNWYTHWCPTNPPNQQPIVSRDWNIRWSWLQQVLQRASTLLTLTYFLPFLFCTSCNSLSVASVCGSSLLYHWSSSWVSCYLSLHMQMSQLPYAW